MKKYIELLKLCPLFEGLSEDNILAVLERFGASVKAYNKNEYIKLTGDSAEFIGIVLEGSIQIVQDDYYGNRHITASFKKGDLFAEAFACAGISTLPVDILSRENTKIMYIESHHILKGCNGSCEFHHTLISNLLKIVSKKNMLLKQKLHYLSQKTTSKKLMAYLNDQALTNNSSEFTIPYDRQGLADFLGVDRSALSAEISKLTKQGILSTKRNWFRLHL
ncbi:MAG: Crp/Fnr family transcriptional regulator [Coprococcus sp.]|nr:Crp/Fnr family transcriptional regulator [Coprococcus sp.]